MSGLEQLIELIREIHAECPCLGDMERFCAGDIRKQAANLYMLIVAEVRES